MFTDLWRFDAKDRAFGNNLIFLQKFCFHLGAVERSSCPPGAPKTKVGSALTPISAN